MVNIKEIKFELFRYQLLTTSQGFIPFFTEFKSADEIREKKNEYFFKALNEIDEWIDPLNRLQVRSEVIYSDDDLYIFKIGSKKVLTYADENFKENTTDDWPHVTVVINNDPNVQVIAVTPNPKAFSASSRVINIIMETLQESLKYYGLTVFADPIFDKKKFWDVVEKYKGKVYSVRFEMISPNISNIRKTLDDQVIQARDNYNAKKSIMGFEADNNSSLTLTQDDEFLSGIVDYSSEGGGKIVVKARGEKDFHTGEQIKTVSVPVKENEMQRDLFERSAKKLFEKLKMLIK